MKTSMLVLACALGVSNASPARADHADSGGDALPCNALCRQWMGVDTATPPPAIELHTRLEPAPDLTQPGEEAPQMAPLPKPPPTRPVVVARPVAIRHVMSPVVLPPPRPRLIGEGVRITHPKAPLRIAKATAVPAPPAIPAPVAPSAPAPIRPNVTMAPPALPAGVPLPATRAILASAPPPAAPPIVASSDVASPALVAPHAAFVLPILDRPVATIPHPAGRAASAGLPPAFDVIAALLLAQPRH